MRMRPATIELWEPGKDRHWRMRAVAKLCVAVMVLASQRASFGRNRTFLQLKSDKAPPPAKVLLPSPKPKATQAL